MRLDLDALVGVDVTGKRGDLGLGAAARGRVELRLHHRARPLVVPDHQPEEQPVEPAAPGGPQAFEIGRGSYGTGGHPPLTAM